MEAGKEYWIKNLVVDGKALNKAPETCKVLKVLDDGTCIVENKDGYTRLFRQDMLSTQPGEVYAELRTVKESK